MPSFGWRFRSTTTVLTMTITGLAADSSSPARIALGAPSAIHPRCSRVPFCRQCFFRPRSAGGAGVAALMVAGSFFCARTRGRSRAGRRTPAFGDGDGAHRNRCGERGVDRHGPLGRVRNGYSAAFDRAPLPSRTRLGARHLVSVATHRWESEARARRAISRDLRTYRATRPDRALGDLSHHRLRRPALGRWLAPGTDWRHSPVQR